jgi:hypothetical protein
MSGDDHLKLASYDLALVEVSDHGWLVRSGSGEPFWLPRRHCSVEPPSPEVGQIARWSVPGWLSSKRGLR